MHDRLVIPPGTQKVWFDIGTAGNTHFQGDLSHDPTVFVVGIEPTPSYAASMRALAANSTWSAQFQMLECACSDRDGTAELFVHPLQECNSLLPVSAGHVVLGGDCVGKKPSRTTVRTTMLRPLLSQVAAAGITHIELLKADTQGNEWTCLESAGELLRMVDNVFIEIQDLPGSKMYRGAAVLSVAEMDNRLSRWDFVRQYCEDNRTPREREFNCLWTRRGRPHLWVTGRAAPEVRNGWRYYGEVPSTAAGDGAPLLKWQDWIAGVSYVGNLTTTSVPGALDARLRQLGRRFTRPNKMLG